MTHKVIVGKGKARVEMTGALAGELETAILDALGPIAERSLELADAVLSDARKEWPVKTERSKRGLRTVWTVDPTRMKVEATVVAEERYSRYIMRPRGRVILHTDSWGNPRYEVVARHSSESGADTVIYARTERWRQGRSTKRGGVVQDLLRTPMKAQRKLLRQELPALVLRILKREGLVHG